MDEICGLERIEIKDLDPIVLFKEWQDEHRDFTQELPTIMNFATCTKDGCVSNRNVLLEDLIGDTFVFFTDKNSRKIKEINENPNVSSCFLWIYTKDTKQITRQVRVEGKVEAMSEEESRYYYERKPTFCKIRYYICDQNKEVDWNELKQKYDLYLQRVKEDGLKLPMPDNQSAYKIVPTKIEFYSAFSNYIADRVLFTKLEDGDWKNVHLAA